MPSKVSDLAESHIFFATQVVEIAPETGLPFRLRKNSLAIAVAIDILPARWKTSPRILRRRILLCDRVSHDTLGEILSTD